MNEASRWYGSDEIMVFSTSLSADVGMVCLFLYRVPRLPRRLLAVLVVGLRALGGRNSSGGVVGGLATELYGDMRRVGLHR